ncbi:MAG: serine/threonine protein kinase, partial [Actinomycetes bacterium]
AAGVIVLLLLGLGTIGLLASRGDQPTRKASGRPSTTPAPTSTSASPSPSPTSSSATPSSSPTQSQAGGAPAGFRTYTDPTGFSVAVPQGWQTSRSGTQVKFQDPSSNRYLLVDQTDQPKKDPKKDWERQEKSFAATHDNYRRISIETVSYRDYPAADWKYTYATQTRVTNRGFVTGGKGYALYMSGPQGTWAQSEQIFNQAAQSFAPAG